MMADFNRKRLLDGNDGVLLIIDVQEKFVPVIHDYEELVDRIEVLVQACKRLNVPIFVSEQYPAGLGPTVGDIKKELPETAIVMEKTAFGCLGDQAMKDTIAGLNRKQVMVCGIEAHVCVNQTVHQLLAEGYQVHVIQDAVASRHKKNYKAALAKMTQSGAVPSCVEMALFELMGTARHESFKELQALIK